MDLDDKLEAMGIPYPFCYSNVPNGWEQLLIDTLQKCIDAGWNKRGLAQYKEKFGKMIVYIDEITSAISSILTEAEQESTKICQECGAPGTHMNIRGWLVTLCLSCKDLRYDNS